MASLKAAQVPRSISLPHATGPLQNARHFVTYAGGCSMLGAAQAASPSSSNDEGSTWLVSIGRGARWKRRDCVA